MQGSVKLIHVKPSAYIIAAVALLLIPLPWVAGWFVAVLVHEVSHCLALHILGISISDITVSSSGVHMETAAMTERDELISAAAGPVGGFCLALLANRFPQMAVCANVQSLFNLIPVYPFDGGRVVRAGLIHVLGYNRGCLIYCRVETVVKYLLIGLFGFWGIKYDHIFFALGAFAAFKMGWSKNSLQRR